MIQRIVLLKLDADFANEASRSEIAAYSRSVLIALPGVLDVEVAVAADPASADRWDISLLIHFNSLSDVEGYRIHPDHRIYVDEYLKPKLADITALNFTVIDDGR